MGRRSRVLRITGTDVYIVFFQNARQVLVIPFSYSMSLYIFLRRALLVIVLLSSFEAFSQEKNFEVRTIAFYNVENLFDTINDPKKFDDDRTPSGRDNYTSSIYWDRIDKLSKVIAEIGSDDTNMSPVIIGLCEVENSHVLEDLVASEKLRPERYGIVHFESPDERGIDVALLYRKQYFKPISESTHNLFITNSHNYERDYTRDQLLVSGLLEGELFHIIVNHWPSRSGGQAQSEPKRIAAAKLNRKLIDSLQRIDSLAKIITMGDFNDDPNNASIKTVLNGKEKKHEVRKNIGLYNPMASMFRQGFNTLAYRDWLNLFDQIIFTQPLLKKEYDSYRFYKAGIYNKRYLTNQKGRHKGYPLRSYEYRNYQGGYSDHFPVYIYLIREKK